MLCSAFFPFVLFKLTLISPRQVADADAAVSPPNFTSGAVVKLRRLADPCASEPQGVRGAPCAWSCMASSVLALVVDDDGLFGAVEHVYAGDANGHPGRRAIVLRSVDQTAE